MICFQEERKIKKKVLRLTCPAQSPDLNAVEKIRHTIKLKPQNETGE